MNDEVRQYLKNLHLSQILGSPDVIRRGGSCRVGAAVVVRKS